MSYFKSSICKSFDINYSANYLFSILSMLLSFLSNSIYSICNSTYAFSSSQLSLAVTRFLSAPAAIPNFIVLMDS